MVPVKYDVVYEALGGEIECGDQYLVKELDNSILIAVADGLGHGVEAAFAAKKAMNILDTNADQSIETLVKMCDQELQQTRGVVMTIARITDKNILTYAAIGNVTGVCWQLDETGKVIRNSFLMQGGIIGYRLPLFEVKKISIKPGDIFILATDGINEKFEIEPPIFESPERIAKHLFKKYRNPKDDGLLLVAQFL